MARMSREEKDWRRRARNAGSDAAGSIQHMEQAVKDEQWFRARSGWGDQAESKYRLADIYQRHAVTMTVIAARYARHSIEAQEG